jgi:hypothetical protein
MEIQAAYEEQSEKEGLGHHSNLGTYLKINLCCQIPQVAVWRRAKLSDGAINTKPLLSRFRENLNQVVAEAATTREPAATIGRLAQTLF